jgi:DNA-directed RNA polymerase subunit RPC12/RpoP
MVVPALCDRCKKEFYAEEDDVQAFIELLCPDCEEDRELNN